MEKTGKRVDVVKAFSDHPDEKFFDNGVPVLLTVHQGTRASQIMGKRIEVTQPRHDCPDWAPEGGDDGAIFRYDESGDQICTNCGYIRNQDTSDTVNDHEHAGRYDGFSTGNSVSN